MIPTWLHLLSIAFLLLGALCLAGIVADIARYPRHTGIMSLVWQGTALFGTVWVTWQHARYGRLARDSVAHAATARGRTMRSMI